MRDIGLFKDLTNGMETEAFVEGNGRDLGVKTNSLCALSFCFGEDGSHEAGAEALTAFDS